MPEQKTASEAAYERYQAFERERRLNQIYGHEYVGTVRTRVPSKWRLIDLETGEVYGIREKDGSGLDWIKKNDIEYNVKNDTSGT